MPKTYEQYKDAIEKGLIKLVAKQCDEHTLPSERLAKEVGALTGALIVAYQENETLKENEAHYKELYETASKALEEIKAIYETDN